MKFYLATLVFAFHVVLGDVYTPIEVVKNPDPSPTLVNSVDFHPILNRFCVTFTHNNRVIIYQVDENGKISIFQKLENPSAELSCPQHAVFSKDGKNLIVANWCNQTFNIYRADRSGAFRSNPIAVLNYPPGLQEHRPHGIVVSPDGLYLAVAYGASKTHPKALALYRMDQLGTKQVYFELIDLQNLLAIPKGVAFTPDGSHLVVTFSDTNSLAIYPLDWDKEKIVSVPKQVLTGKIARPEDVKFSPDGTLCAVSNSSKNRVTFYKFDKELNLFSQNEPLYTIGEDVPLNFPHGLAFSSDGQYLAITQFGSVQFSENDDLISWGDHREESIVLLKLLPSS